MYFFHDVVFFEKEHYTKILLFLEKASKKGNIILRRYIFSTT